MSRIIEEWLLIESGLGLEAQLYSTHLRNSGLVLLPSMPYYVKYEQEVKIRILHDRYNRYKHNS